MDFTMNANGNSDTVRLPVDKADFRVAVMSVQSADFDGNYKIQYSPDGINWLDHETATNITKNACNNLFFPVPYMRVVVAGRTKGTVQIFVFGA
jgi:hypothetical protein